MHKPIIEFIIQSFYKVNIIHIILITFALQMFVISKPPHEILDEFYFVNFTRWFLMGMDHSPYQLNGLSIIAAPFFYFSGDNWFAWRFPIVIFGIVFLFFSYKVFEKIANKKTAILTSLIISLSPTIFAHSGLMLRDIPLIALGFVAIHLYLQKKIYFAFLVIGFAALIKETALLFLIFVIAHYFVVNYKDVVFKKLLCKKSIATSITCVTICSLSFLIPLYVYDNIITVYEYDTKDREVLVKDEFNGKYTSKIFSPFEHPDDVLESYGDKFNYVGIVKDPIHHLNLMFVKGYYDQNGDRGEYPTTIVQSIIPSSFYDSVSSSYSEQVYVEKRPDKDDPNIKIHGFEFEVLRLQSVVEFHWWFFAFWGIAGLIGFSIYQKVRSTIQISYNVKILAIALGCFFIPFLIINLVRDTFPYYVIYYLPFMAFGLTVILQKITMRNKNVKVISFMILFGTMLGLFLYSFPLWVF